MAVNTRNSIVTNGLVLALDAGNTKSLPEAPSANLMVQSQDFTSANWAKVRSSVTASVATAPDGTLTGTRLVNDASNNTHYVRSDGYTFTAGETYTISYYAKSAELSWIALQINEANTAFLNTYSNLASGSLGSVGSGTTATIQAVGNGWYRTSITRTVVNPGLSYFAIITSTGNSVQSYAGDGTSGTYIWGVQLEKLPYATSYIPTTTTSASRNTWFDISGNGNSGSLINGPTFSSQNGGSIVFDGVNDTTNLGNILNIGLNSWTVSCWFKINSYTSGVQGIVGKTSARGYVGRYAIFIESGLLYAFFQPTSNFLISTSVTPYNDGKWHNAVLSINRTGFMYMYVDGSSVGTPLDVSSTSGVNLNASTDNLYVGSYASDTGLAPIFFFNGNIAQTSIYNRALSQQEVLQNYNATKTRFGL